jgi:hypothetical protein
MQMSRRNAWIAVVAVLVLAVVIVVGAQSRPSDVAVGSPSPTVSARASTTATASAPSSATAAASGSPSGAPASGIYNDDFGFVLTEPGAGRTTTVRRESGMRLGSFDQEQFAVSSDGRQIAWFTPAGAQPQQLRVASAADVTKVRLVRTIGASERGGTIVWSNDASGLLYQTYTPNPNPPATVEQGALYVVHAFDMRNGVSPDRVVLTSPVGGLVFVPIAWDRAANLAAVVETGPGGFMTSYDVIRFNDNMTEAITTKTTTGPPNGQWLAFSVKASSDARLVSGGAFDNGGIVAWWPLADFGARKTIPGGVNALWRPGTHEVATIGGCAGDPACGPNGGVRLLDVEKGTSRIVYGFSTANMNLRTFRTDGSALIVYAPQAPGAGTYDYTLIPLLGGGSPVTFTDVNGLIASVRLR